MRAIPLALSVMLLNKTILKMLGGAPQAGGDVEDGWSGDFTNPSTWGKSVQDTLSMGPLASDGVSNKTLNRVKSVLSFLFAGLALTSEVVTGLVGWGILGVSAVLGAASAGVTGMQMSRGDMSPGQGAIDIAVTVGGVLSPLGVGRLGTALGLSKTMNFTASAVTEVAGHTASVVGGIMSLADSLK